MADPYGTEPMFEVPLKYRPPARQAKYPYWRKYSGRRTSCDDCLVDLAQGRVTFMSQPAVEVRYSEEARRYYCYRHAAAQKLVDETKGLL